VLGKIAIKSQWADTLRVPRLPFESPAQDALHRLIEQESFALSWWAANTSPATDSTTGKFILQEKIRTELLQVRESDPL